MREYLLSVYEPAGEPPPADALAAIRRDLDAVNRDLEAAGSWVFAGGLHAPATATVLRPRGRSSARPGAPCPRRTGRL